MTIRHLSAAPMVSCVVPVRDGEAFLAAAIDSVLAQRYPADRIEIVVVDDGSTDSTPEILDGYGDRIRRLRHDRPTGVNAAVEAGLTACTGDLVTRLDADDLCTPDRFSVLAEALAADREVGLAYSDMTLVDENDRVVAPSFNRAVGITPVSGRVFGRLISGNFVGAGAAMFRAELLEWILPFPAYVGVHDWWIALQAARRSSLLAVPGSHYRYRRHGANLNLGASGAARLPLIQREVPLRRWLLRTVEIEEVGVEALRRALAAFDAQLALLAKLDSAFVPVPGDEDAWLEAMHEASEALDAGDLDGAMGRLIRAAAIKPGDRQSRELISQLGPHLVAPSAAA